MEKAITFKDLRTGKLPPKFVKDWPKEVYSSLIHFSIHPNNDNTNIGIFYSLVNIF